MTFRANRLLKYKGPQGKVVRAGNDAKGVATIAFFPAKKTVKVGDTVTFTMSQHSIETHNVAFGPKAYLDEHATAFPKSDRITFTKAGTYAYYCAVHGNDMAGEIVVK